MTINNRIFVHNTASIRVEKCAQPSEKVGARGDTQLEDVWDIVITDNKGDTVVLFCFGDKPIFTVDLTGEGV